MDKILFGSKLCSNGSNPIDAIVDGGRILFGYDSSCPKLSMS